MSEFKILSVAEDNNKCNCMSAKQMSYRGGITQSLYLSINTDRELTINLNPCTDYHIVSRVFKGVDVTGYPGWQGRISGTLLRPPECDYSYPYSDALNLVGLKTGSGGGGNKDWGFDVKVFLADWPGLGQLLTVNKLKGI